MPWSDRRMQNTLALPTGCICLYGVNAPDCDHSTSHRYHGYYRRMFGQGMISFSKYIRSTRECPPSSNELRRTAFALLTIYLWLASRSRERTTCPPTPNELRRAAYCVGWCPQPESNRRQRFRKPLLYPLSYGSIRGSL